MLLFLLPVGLRLSVFAEEENFHRAAEKLHVSQSPLSRQMQQLKAEVGVDLFEPSGRGVKLTPEMHAEQTLSR